jgi:hypothetical protein
MNQQGPTGSRRWTSAWISGVVVAVLAIWGCGDARENVRILMPEDGDTFVQGVDIVVFQAQLATLSPTNPTGVGLTWLSSLDGLIHADDLEFEIPAESLAVGEHTIVIFAPVRDGRVQDEVLITIEGGAPAR